MSLHKEMLCIMAVMIAMMMVMIMWEVLKSLYLGNGESYPSTPIQKGNTKTAPALPIATAARL